MKRALLINPSDNVATVLEDIVEGDKVAIVSSEGNVMKVTEARQKIPFRHKIAIKSMSPDAEVIKYGEVIGKATQKIVEGEYVHIHNVGEKEERR